MSGAKQASRRVIMSRGLNPPPGWFTIVPSDAGFTDQLMQFTAFYKLGMSLGLEYSHTLFVSRRSGPLLPVRRYSSLLQRLFWKRNHRFSDVYEFLGFNDHFLQGRAYREAANGASRIDLELHDDVLRRAGIDSFWQLQDFILKRIKDLQPSAPKLVFLRLSLTGDRYNLFSLIESAFPELPDGLSLSALYRQTRQRKPWRSRSRAQGLKILVHIRQGDTAVIGTPWGTFVPVDERFPNWLVEESNIIQASSNNQLAPADYAAFLRGMLEYIGTNKFRFSIFSDGYTRALQIIESRPEKLKWTPQQWNGFREQSVDYDKMAFRELSRLPNSEIVVGESNENLYDLIDGVLTADVVVTGAQQRMIPKLVSQFGERKRPAVIVLYKNKQPDYGDIRADHAERFAYVNVQNMCGSEVQRVLKGIAGAE